MWFSVVRWLKTCRLANDCQNLCRVLGSRMFWIRAWVRRGGFPYPKTAAVPNAQLSLSVAVLVCDRLRIPEASIAGKMLSF